MTQGDGVLILRLDSWATGGRAVGRHDGLVCLVAGGAPGDTVEVRVLENHGRFLEGVVDRLIEPSPARRHPPCHVQTSCGGCPLMIVGEPDQRRAKRQFVIDALARIGGFSPDGLVESLVSAPPDLGYRNKIELAFGRDQSGRPVIGYHGGPRYRGVIDVAACTIADPSLAPLLSVAREFFLEGPGERDLAELSSGDSFRLVLRASGSRDERLLAVRGPRAALPSLPAFAKTAGRADPGLVGVVRLIAGSGRRGGAISETIAGRGWLEEEILGIRFEVPAATFLQVHAPAAALLSRRVLELAGTPGHVVELYGGIGTHGLALARAGAQVTIVDADPGATACGQAAAREAGIAGAGYERADVSEFLGRHVGKRAPDLIILDPPRTGLERGVAEKLAACRAPRLLYVSCDPATLARDLAALRSKGYAVVRVTPFDLFPQTAHVESVAEIMLPPSPP